VRLFEQTISERGVVLAVITAHREPIAHTVVRALTAGVNLFWNSTAKTLQHFNRTLADIQKRQSKGKTVEDLTIIGLIQEIAETSQTGLLLVIDELGKCLEHSVRNRGIADLYLLQQISELPNNMARPVYLVGLLHQAFSEYAY